MIRFGWDSPRGSNGRKQRPTAAIAATATRRAGAATTNKKEERIKRERMLITGGIGAAPEKTPAREKHCGCIFQKRNPLR